jgi:hypothetical protein
MSTSFDLDQFIADCRAACEADPSHKLVREVVARAVADPAGVFKGLGEPKRAEIQKLHQSDTLTILNVIWAPKMTIMPHDHRMWAVIGVYSGREDNIFWRRLPGEGGRLEAAGGEGALDRGCRTPWAQHHSLGHQPDRPPYRRHPRLWRRLLPRRAQRVGSRDIARRAVQRGEEPPAVRRGKCGVERLKGVLVHGQTVDSLVRQRIGNH